MNTKNINWKSQEGQDAWVFNTLQSKRNGYFVDLAAHDPVRHSNTYVLEQRFGWKGICIEPNNDRYKDLLEKRSSICINDIISSESTEVEYVFRKNAPDIVSGTGLNHIKGFSNHPGTKKTTQAEKERGISPDWGSEIRKARTLESVLDSCRSPAVIDYLSLDVEGYEYEIMKNFKFDQYIFRCITVEGDLIHHLLVSNGYTFVTKGSQNRDSYYVYGEG